MSFKNYIQLDTMDCGPTCLRMISKFYGKLYSLHELRKLCDTNKSGTSLLALSTVAEQIGFKTVAAKVSLTELKDELPLPCIAHWKQNHFVVIYKISKENVYVSDPGFGNIKYSKKEFQQNWSPTEEKGVTLLFEPTSEFYNEEEQGEKGKTKKGKFSRLFNYLRIHKKLVIQLIVGMLVSSLLTIILPYFSQSIVDVGIKNHDIGFIYLVFAAQLFVFLGRISVEFIRSWILLHLSTRINLSLLSDFFIKLMKLPIAFFDAKMMGDILQRINDHYRIQQFLTGTSLSTLFSFINLIIFSIIIASYNLQIFIVFILGSILYLAWVILFQKKRKEIDHKMFSRHAINQSLQIELITGMQEIKLQNAETYKRWEWERAQAKSFHLNIKSLRLNQIQDSGAQIIHELKNICISIFSAQLVIQGEISLGMMMAMSYIVGQLNAPIQQFVSFIHSFQDARLSYDRLSEIHEKEDEVKKDVTYINGLPERKSLSLENVSFKYNTYDEEYILDKINLVIPENKITAIVGTSGSGKTTLMKLLLNFYVPQQGDILVGDKNLKLFAPNKWRGYLGSVMQEGYIFSDTIVNNIVIGSEKIDEERVKFALKVANIHEYVEKLPLGLQTKIGREGSGLSTGQKQRLLIARAVYKDPDYLFFDEATSALDAKNERVVMENLLEYFQGKTVLVVAHRLSTVKNADKIVVLESGRIAEEGSHTELVTQKGKYYELIKNQLELGN